MNHFPASDAEQRPREFHARLPRSAGGLAHGSALKHRGRRFAALAAAIAVPAMAAPGDWQPLQDFTSQTEEVQAELMPFETAGQSFPGSAFYYLDDDVGPARAVAVNFDMPGQNEGLRWDNEEPATSTLAVGPAARAFFGGGSGIDKSRALQCMTMAIYYEARSEANVGQRAVAQVVLNRVAHPTYPNSVCGVVFQGSERRTGCQFSFTCDGSLAKRPNRIFWDRARGVAASALAGNVYAPVGYATHYHTLAVNPYWAPSLQTVGVIGFHRFYRWKGQAGTASAFRAAYNGREPMAAPHVRSAADDFAATADPIELERAYEAGRRKAEVAAQAAVTAPVPAPAYSAEVRARGGDAIFKADRLPESGGIKAEYANAGKWIAQPN